MSEDEYDYDDDCSDDQGDDDQQSDDKPQEEIDMENDYYQADDEKNTSPETALKLFLKVIKKEEEYRQNPLQHQEFIFNSLKNVIVLMCRLQKPENLKEQMEKILTYMGTVARNDATEAINEFTENLVKLEDKHVMKSVLELILEYLQNNNMEQLLNKALFKLAYIYFDMKEYANVESTLKKIFLLNRNKDGTDDEKKAATLLECYALEIMLSVQKNQPIKKILKRVQLLRAQEKNSITDNRIMGIIQENTGKMYMKQRKYNDANQEFYDAFKAYQEVGNAKAKQVLKYWCFASILSKGIDPFAEQSTQVYSQDEEIQAMQNLRLAYQNEENPNIRKFKNILDKKENHINDDDFLKDYTQELKKTMSLKKVVSMVQGYEKIKLKYIANQVLCNENEVERYLMELITSQQIDGYIDSKTGVFENSAQKKDPIEKQKLQNISKWTATIAVM